MMDALARLVAIQEISDLIGRYCMLFDDEDWAGLDELWTDDAAFVVEDHEARQRLVDAAEVRLIDREVCIDEVRDPLVGQVIARGRRNLRGHGEPIEACRPSRLDHTHDGTLPDESGDQTRSDLIKQRQPRLDRRPVGIE